MKTYPKLRYPLDRRALDMEPGLILLAYDMIYRWSQVASVSHLDKFEGITLIHDTEANLDSLGDYINAKIGSDRFEP